MFAYLMRVLFSLVCPTLSLVKSLHWPPVQHRINLKIMLIVHKALNGLAPQYMTDLLTEYSPNRPLRTIGACRLTVPRIRSRSSEGGFGYFGPAVWNKLPDDLRSVTTVSTFNKKPKT